MLTQKTGLNILLDTGLGSGELFNEKQLRNFGVKEESTVEFSLQKLGLNTKDINIVIMTYMHFDHACGLTKWKDGQLISAFPNAKIITSSIEWEEMKHPNIRSRNTYWKENWEAIERQVALAETLTLVTDGIEVHHTGGHSDGHSDVILQDGGETVVHMADLMPTYAHENSLWLSPYDDLPIASIENKQKWLEFGATRNAWFTFYHDVFYRGIKWNDRGDPRRMD